MQSYDAAATARFLARTPCALEKSKGLNLAKPVMSTSTSHKVFDNIFPGSKKITTLDLYM